MIPGSGSISSLPDELLVTIIELTIFETNRRHQKTCVECALIPNNGYVKALSQVSHRFRQIAQPYLFHAPRTRDVNELGEEKPMKELQEILESQTAIRDHIRVLELHITRRTAVEELEAAQYIVEQLGSPYCLTLHLERSTDLEWESKKIGVVTAVVQLLTNIKHARVVGSLCYASQLRECSWKSLARLDLVDLEVRWPQEDVIFESESASFSALSIRNCSLDTKMIEALIKWSIKLEDFSFVIRKDRISALWNLNLLQALQHHSSTLCKIEIFSGRTANFDGLIFDATLFPALNHLSLSFYDKINILSPGVTDFTLDFSTHEPSPGGEPRETWSHFTPQVEVGLRSIAMAAVDQNAALRTIHVEFNPSDDGRESPNPWNYYNIFSASYPWEQMDRVRDEVLRPSGRILTYSKPPFETREAWQRDFAGAAKRRENQIRRSLMDARAEERQRSSHTRR